MLACGAYANEAFGDWRFDLCSISRRVSAAGLEPISPGDRMVDTGLTITAGQALSISAVPLRQQRCPSAGKSLGVRAALELSRAAPGVFVPQRQKDCIATATSCLPFVNRLDLG